MIFVVIVVVVVVIIPDIVVISVIVIAGFALGPALLGRGSQMKGLEDGFGDDVTVADGKDAVPLAADAAFEPVVVDASEQQNHFALFQTHLHARLSVELVLGDGLAFGEKMLRFPVAQGGGGAGRGIGVGDGDDGGFGDDGSRS